MARAGLTLAEADRPRVIGAILSLAYHYEGRDIFHRLVERLMATKVWEKQLVETLERGIAEGIALGEERGLARGRAEERRALLRRLLEQRFGAIPPALEARIAASDTEALTALFDRALVAPTLADL